MSTFTRLSGRAQRNTVTGLATSMNTATTATPPEVFVNQCEIDLCAQQDEDEHTHDQGRGQHEVVQLLLLAFLHRESKCVLVANHDSEHEYGHETARLQAVGTKVPITAMSDTTGAYSCRKPKLS